MKTSLFLALLAFSAVACNRTEPSEQAPRADTESVKAAPEATDPHAGLSSYDVDRVAELLEKQALVPVDANSPGTREKYGTLPSAVLLSSSDDYALSELPSDKEKGLVFYCGGERCTSAPKAAKRAMEAGYQNVHVMRAGIRGWVKAGKKIDKAQS